MITIKRDRPTDTAGFHSIAKSFLDQPGLPFADVLGADDIERAFVEKNALFAMNDIFSTPVVLWAFLAQTLRDGKGASCQAAVTDIANFMIQTGRQPPCGAGGRLLSRPRQTR
jgi:hypothetical protein